MTLEIGAEAPDFTLKSQHGEEVALSSFRGAKAVVIVFIPFAFTGTCTGELCEIRDNYGDLASDDVEVLAISCDSQYSIRVYSEQENYPFTYLSDFWPHGSVASSYGVFNESVGCAVRGTFIVDKAGVLRWQVVHKLGQARDVAAYRAALAELD